MKKSAMVCALCILLITFLYAAINADSGLFILDSLTDQYEAVEFDHSNHMLLADSCSTCHHEHGGSRSQCDDCHSVSESTFKSSVVNSFSACKDCHDDIDPDNPGMPGLKVAYHRVCFTCHIEMSDIGIDPRGCTEMCHAMK